MKKNKDLNILDQSKIATYWEYFLPQNREGRGLVGFAYFVRKSCCPLDERKYTIMEYLNFQMISSQIQAFQEFLSWDCLDCLWKELNLSQVFEWGEGGEEAERGEEKVKHSRLHIYTICTQPHFIKILHRVRLGHYYHGSKICESILWTEQHVGCGGRWRWGGLGCGKSRVILSQKYNFLSMTREEGVFPPLWTKPVQVAFWTVPKQVRTPKRWWRRGGADLVWHFFLK